MSAWAAYWGWGGRNISSWMSDLHGPQVSITSFQVLNFETENQYLSSGVPPLQPLFMNIDCDCTITVYVRRIFVFTAMKTNILRSELISAFMVSNIRTLIITGKNRKIEIIYNLYLTIIYNQYLTITLIFVLNGGNKKCQSMTINQDWETHLKITLFLWLLWNILCHVGCMGDVILMWMFRDLGFLT